MERDPSSRAAELSAAHLREVRREVRECGIPVVALRDPAPLSGGRLGGCEQVGGAVTNVEIVYDGDGVDGPWASVHTSRWVGTRVSSGPLRELVEHHMRMRGERLSAVEWAEGAATVVVDGQPVAGRIVRAGDRWWAVRCGRGDIEISVVARDWRRDRVAVDTVADLDALLSQRAPRPAPQAPVKPEPVPDELGREPHRALVDVVLRSSRARVEWLADGGPVPQLPAYWGALWQAAVQRQMALAEQDEPEAKWEVQSTVAHLSTLQHSAAWFRDDARLRERAIAETLLYGTRLGRDVPSQRAQQAWQRRHEMAPPADYPEVEAGVAAEGEWLDAWAAWANDQACGRSR
jgi:hypothetical protein